MFRCWDWLLAWLVKPLLAQQLTDQDGDGDSLLLRALLKSCSLLRCDLNRQADEFGFHSVISRSSVNRRMLAMLK